MRQHPTALPSAWPIAGGHASVALVVGSLASAGIARHVEALARGLGAGRHRVHVYVLEDAPAGMAERLAARNVPLTVLPRRRPYEPGRVMALTRALKRDGIDLVHAILPAGAAYGAIAARLAGVPIVIVSTRAGDPPEQRRVRTLLHRIYRNATALTANTQAQARQLAAEAQVPVERVQVIYDGVDLTRHPLPGMLDGIRERVWHRPLVVGGAGRTAGSRLSFLAAATLIAARHPDIRFVWLEDGATLSGNGHEAFAERPAGLPLSTVAVGDDPEPVLAQLAVLCLTGDAFDLVPSALAAGRPIVTVAAPGVDELVTDGTTGKVVAAGDPGAFAEAALSFIEDRSRLRAAGQAARAHAVRVLGADLMVRATTALYEATLLGRPSPAPDVQRAHVAVPGH
ncbi:MAG: glycosyltransferase family 4 protein [Candidatus Binatia bacterium]